MTTRVHVDAHAGWPVQVEQIDVAADGTEKVAYTTVVKPMTTGDFHVWDGRMLRVTELRRETT